MQKVIWLFALVSLFAGCEAKLAEESTNVSTQPMPGTNSQSDAALGRISDEEAVALIEENSSFTAVVLTSSGNNRWQGSCVDEDGLKCELKVSIMKDEWECEWECEDGGKGSFSTYRSAPPASQNN